jgi:hypothetical protein
MQEGKSRSNIMLLPPRLQALLANMTHRELAGKLERVYRAASLAIDRLSHLNIVKYEPTTVSETDGADLSLWETMAPAIRDTVVDVNALIGAIQETFPRPEQLAEGEWVPPPPSLDARLALEVEVVLHASASRLSRRVADLGQRVRRPEVVSDRWALMAELQSFRSDFRAQIGDLVYLTAAALGDVRREEVVPGHAHQVSGLVALRRAAADLRRALASRMERVEPGKAPALAQRLEEMLGAFISMPATAVLMKTRDKRRLVELREKLRGLVDWPTLEESELRELMEPFLKSLEQLPVELTQGPLAVHDRAMWTTCSARLEQATMHLFLGSPGTERMLREALTSAESLYGRSEGFDQFLRRARATAEQGFTDESMRELLEMFRDRLASLPTA